MPEINYKFKSSLSFETIQFDQPTIRVRVLKDLINQRQSIKTSGFDLKFKDSEGTVYTDDDDLIDLKWKIIVSRVPRTAKSLTTQINDNKKKKEVSIPSNVNDNLIEINRPETSAIENDDKINVDVVVPIETVVEKPVFVVPNALKCPLCNDLMKDAMQINCCKKNYCYQCITGYLFDPDISGSLECPDCRSIMSNRNNNLIENSQIRSMIRDLKQGKLNCENIDRELMEIPVINPDELVIIDDDIHEIEIASTVPDAVFSGEIDTGADSVDNIDSLSSSMSSSFSNQINELPSSANQSNELSGFIFTPDQSTQLSVIESIVHETHTDSVQPAIEDVRSSVIVDSASINCIGEVNQIEQHYHGNNYTINQLMSDNQLGNRTGIPVINTTHLTSEIKTNPATKDMNNIPINDLEFDPVIYMKFLKIVGESCPDELRKILSNNNESVHISKERKKSCGASRRPRDSSYHEKHVPKKSRYDIENDDTRYKKTYTPIEKHLDTRYYESVEKKSNRARSRSKEYYQKKVDPYSSCNRRSRDYEVRDREYYGSSSGARYRNSENQNYQDDRHKYRPSYNSLSRIKSGTKYKRVMDR